MSKMLSENNLGSIRHILALWGQPHQQQPTYKVRTEVFVAIKTVVEKMVVFLYSVEYYLSLQIYSKSMFYNFP